ncbi:related to UTP23 - essential nucleolar protein that is a component of the SSU processome [Ustilago bromivora]|nr:related to UTP23 - essential nucleolar protein that is a component of the SSU processome [Ustilago bromivora]
MLHQYHLQFGFREPYQLVIDDTFSLALSRYKISDPVHQFGNVLVSKKIKPLITQCSMQALYALGKQHQSTIDMAKQWERRMCNHREALPTAECIKQCVGPENKHRYIVASEQGELRRDLRLNVPGLPMMHFTQAVIVLEPMSALTRSKIEEKEETKLSLPASEAGLFKNQPKVEVDIVGGEAEGETAEAAKQGESTRKRKRRAPNPLSMRKPKSPRLTMEEKLKREQELKKQKQRAAARARMEAGKLGSADSTADGKAGADDGAEGARRKRKRSNKSSSTATAAQKVSQGEKKESTQTLKTAKPKADANGAATAPTPTAEGAPPKKRRSRGKGNSSTNASAATVASAAVPAAESSS